MKKITLLLLSLCLVFGGTAFAADNPLLTTGLISGDVGLRDCSNSDDEDCGSHAAFSLGGKFSLPLWNSFSLQLDADYETYNSGSDQAEKQQAVALHASYRNPDNFLVGVFGGYAAGQADSEDKVSGNFYGAEAQYYFSRITLYGQYGDAGIDNYDDSDNNFEGQFFTAAVRYFPTDDIMLQVGYQYGKSPDDFEDDGDWGKGEQYSFEGNMRLIKSIPLYGVAKLSRSSYEANTEDDGDVTRLMFGLKYYFGASSLFENDRQGATLSTSLLPSRSATWASVLD